MLTRAHPAFDRPVILFRDIIEVLYRSMQAVLLQSHLGFELHDGWCITGVLVGVDDARRWMVLTAQGLGQKALSRKGQDRCISPHSGFNRLTKSPKFLTRENYADGTQGQRA